MKKRIMHMNPIDGLQPISDTIRNRLIKQKIDFRSNDNISDYIDENELNLLQQEVEEKMHEVLKSLVIDVDNDWNTQETAKRVAKMWLKEVFSGRYEKKPKITDFPNASGYDNLYVTGPISIRSTCAHHFQNITGKCWIGVFPGEKVIGLSKFNRLVDWIASRPQIQEELSEHIADAVEKETKAKGIAVVLKAHHACLTHRGAKEHESDMTTAVMRGELRTNVQLKQEFYNLLNNMKGI